MELIIEIVSSDFKLTGNRGNPTEINYDIVCFQKGLYRNSVNDSKGDVTLIGFYRTREGVEGSYTYSNPVVEEYRTYQRSVATGLPSASTSKMKYYCEDESFWETNEYTKYYTSEEGYKLNQQSREVLLNRASMWLYKDLLTEFGYPLGDQKAKEFSRNLSASDKTDYIKSDRSYLLNSIAESTFDFMTTQRKSTLNYILNVTFS